MKNKSVFVLVALLCFGSVGFGYFVLPLLIGHSQIFEIVSVSQKKNEHVLNTNNKEKDKNTNTDDKLKKDSDDEDEEDLDGNYGDPVSCAALNDENSYGKEKEEFLFMLAGKEGWVFRSQQDLRQDFQITQDDTDLYLRFAEVLRERGTELIIAYIPTRGFVASEFLPDNNPHTKDFDAVTAREKYSAMLSEMSNKGINIVGNAEPKIGAAYFNHADQHWTTSGAQTMAKSLAEKIKTFPQSQALPKKRFVTQIGKEILYDGRFGEFIEELCGFRPQPEKDKKVKTLEEAGENASDALFSEASVPRVVLVGTSNSKRDEFDTNFSGFLEEELSTEVLNAAISGGGMDDSLVAYLNSDHFRKNPPAFLIWELPGYYNLGGAGMEDALRQAIAIVYGVCQNPIAESGSLALSGKKLDLIKGLAEQKVDAHSTYISLRFNKPIDRDFFITYKTSDKKTGKFKFRRAREYQGQNFYFIPKVSDGAEGILYTNLSVNTKKDFQDISVEAQICPTENKKMP